MEGRIARPLKNPLPDLVGLSEIAERFDVQRATVDQWKHRGVLPVPDYDLAGGPVWLWTTIETWGQRSGRL